MRMSKVFILVLSIGFFSCQPKTTQERVSSIKTENKAVLVNMNPSAFADKMAGTADYALLDVRSVAEFKQGHIAGAINADVNSRAFAEVIKGIDKNKPVLLYCAVGGRSSYAARLMREQGFTQLYHLNDGIVGWAREGMALVK